MAFIKNKERESLIKKINKSYTFRKVIISLEILLLLGYIAVIFASLWMTADGNHPQWNWYVKEGDKYKLTGLGIGMAVYTALIVFFGLISLIFTFTLKSPKDTQANMVKLEKSPLSGKKNNDADSHFGKVRNRSKKQDN